MSVTVLKRLFTVDEYLQMGCSGIFTEDDRVELIEGEIIRMSPIGNRHYACVNCLTMLFCRYLDRKAVVHVQNPIDLDKYSEPQPDIVLLKHRSDFYKGKRPQPEDVLLVVEVADSTLDFDRYVKVPLYARHGITEVWIVDLEKQQLEVHRNPTLQGYENVELFQPGQSLSPQAFPEIQLAVSDILG